MNFQGLPSFHAIFCVCPIQNHMLSDLSALMKHSVCSVYSLCSFLESAHHRGLFSVCSFLQDIPFGGGRGWTGWTPLFSFSSYQVGHPVHFQLVSVFPLSSVGQASCVQTLFSHSWECLPHTWQWPGLLLAVSLLLRSVSPGAGRRTLELDDAKITIYV